MSLFYKHNKTGAGIEKNAPDKNRIVVYFEILVRKFWKMLTINLLYTIFLIPFAFVFYALLNMNNFTSKIVVSGISLVAFVLLFGPATAGVFKIMRNYALEKHSFILTDFKKAFTENYKKSFLMGLIDIVVLFSVYAAIKVYPNMAQVQDSYFMYVPMVLSISLGIGVIFISFYSYLLIVATDISFGNIIRNSIVLTILEIKRNLISFAVTILLVALFVVLIIFNLYTIAILPFVPAVIIIFTITFNSYPVIQKYVINPYYEQNGQVNPELDNVYDDDDILFEDMGGKETPVDNSKKNKKKTIS